MGFLWEMGTVRGADSCRELWLHSPALAGSLKLQRGSHSCLGSWDTGLAPTRGRGLFLYLQKISFH